MSLPAVIGEQLARDLGLSLAGGVRRHHCDAGRRPAYGAADGQCVRQIWRAAGDGRGLVGRCARASCCSRARPDRALTMRAGSCLALPARRCCRRRPTSCSTRSPAPAQTADRRADACDGTIVQPVLADHGCADRAIWLAHGAADLRGADGRRLLSAACFRPSGAQDAAGSQRAQAANGRSSPIPDACRSCCWSRRSPCTLSSAGVLAPSHPAAEIHGPGRRLGAAGWFAARRHPGERAGAGLCRRRALERADDRTAAAIVIPIGFATLLLGGPETWAIAVFMLLYGGGGGAMAVARATMPLVFYDQAAFARASSHIALPASIAASRIAADFRLGADHVRQQCRDRHGARLQPDRACDAALPDARASQDGHSADGE